MRKINVNVYKRRWFYLLIGLIFILHRFKRDLDVFTIFSEKNSSKRPDYNWLFSRFSPGKENASRALIIGLTICIKFLRTLKTVQKTDLSFSEICSVLKRDANERFFKGLNTSLIREESRNRRFQENALVISIVAINFPWIGTAQPAFCPRGNDQRALRAITALPAESASKKDVIRECRVASSYRLITNIRVDPNVVRQWCVGVMSRWNSLFSILVNRQL